MEHYCLCAVLCTRITIFYLLLGASGESKAIVNGVPRDTIGFGASAASSTTPASNTTPANSTSQTSNKTTETSRQPVLLAGSGPAVTPLLIPGAGNSSVRRITTPPNILRTITTTEAASGTTAAGVGRGGGAAGGSGGGGVGGGGVGGSGGGGSVPFASATNVMAGGGGAATVPSGRGWKNVNGSGNIANNNYNSSISSNNSSNSGASPLQGGAPTLASITAGQQPAATFSQREFPKLGGGGGNTSITSNISSSSNNSNTTAVAAASPQQDTVASQRYGPGPSLRPQSKAPGTCSQP